MYQPNPPRKCGGSKQPDSFYLESGPLSPDGALHGWSWLLGDGQDRYIAFSKQEVPPRQVVGINPIMTLLFETYVPANGPALPVPFEKMPLYEQLQAATKNPGIADHVGDQYYSAYNFYQETAMFGPSRKVPKAVAKMLAGLIAEHGPLPMIFAHPQIPVFRSADEYKQALDLVGSVMHIEWEYKYTYPTWTADNWGMYARRDHWTGSSHFMIPILSTIDTLKDRWQTVKDVEGWPETRELFKGLRYVKQTFGCSWMCQVSYTLPTVGAIDDEVMEIPGINIIDLEALGEEDEQTEKAPLGADK